MAKFIDISGQKFGRWTVIEPIKKQNIREVRRWKCICECGNVGFIDTWRLKEGLSKSCGCFRYERFFEINKTHGMSKTKIYTVWGSMKERCYNPNTDSYKVYGGRGIIVCDRWLNSFENFYEDMGDIPKDHSIERINVNGNYEPNNCKWIHKSHQQKNTQRTKLIDTPWGVLYFAEAARRIGINQASLRDRIKWGWTGEKLFGPRHEKFVRYKNARPKDS